MSDAPDPREARIDRLERDNARLVEALSWYASARWSDLDDDLWTDEAGAALPGRRARAVLKAIE